MKFQCDYTFEEYLTGGDSGGLDPEQVKRIDAFIEKRGLSKVQCIDFPWGDSAYDDIGACDVTGMQTYLADFWGSSAPKHPVSESPFEEQASVQ